MEYLYHSTLSSNPSVFKQYYTITPTQVDSASSHSGFELYGKKNNNMMHNKKQVIAGHAGSCL